MIGTRIRKLLLAAAVVLAVQTAVIEPSGAQVASNRVPQGIPIQQWGYPGSLVGLMTQNFCTQFGTYRVMDAARFEVRNAPRYYNSWQRVQLNAGLQQLTATGWRTVYWHPQVRSYYLQPGYSTVRPYADWSFNVSRGTFRTIETVTWYVGSAMVGQASYIFDGDSYIANGDARRGMTGDYPDSCTFF